MSSEPRARACWGAVWVLAAALLAGGGVAAGQPPAQQPPAEQPPAQQPPAQQPPAQQPQPEPQEQAADPPPTPPAAPELRQSPSADVRWFYHIYDIDNPLFGRAMQVADLSAYPAFFAVAPALWVRHLQDDDDMADTIRLTAAEVAAFVTMAVMKRTWPKPRPYVALPDVIPRDRPRSTLIDPTSFPSGHTMVSFNLATSWALANPRWYVIVPGALWATSVGLSRIWLGMHYPVDVLSGAAIGSALAVAAYLLVPENDDGEGSPSPPPGLTVWFRF